LRGWRKPAAECGRGTWQLRVIREDKRGFIPGESPRLMESLAIDPNQFIAPRPET